MATSSITRNVRIEGEEAVKRFVDAIEQAEEWAKTNERIPVSYRKVSEKSDIANLIRNIKK